jgi:hypothetical protein
LGANLRAGLFHQYFQTGPQLPVQEIRCSVVIRMGAPGRLGHDLVDNAHRFEIRSRDFQSSGCNASMILVLPENGGTALGCNDGINGIFLHQYAIADGYTKSSAAASFSDDTYNNGYEEARHLSEIERDGFGLTPFLSSDSRVSTGGIDEADYRTPEFVRQFHSPDGLTIAFGLGISEISILALFYITPLLVSHNHYRCAVVNGHAGYHGGIIGESPISMDFGKILEKPSHIIESVRSHVVPGKEGMLPGGVSMFFNAQSLHLGSQAVNFRLGCFSGIRHFGNS